MAFKKDQRVFIGSLKKEGVVVGLLKSGEYKVAVGTVMVVCAEDDLSVPPKSKLSKYKAAPKHHPAIKPVSNLAAQRNLESLDLHGMRVVEAMALVEKRINEAIMGDIERVRIVHGIGSGKILEALHKYLDGLKVISHYRLDDANPGVTWVYF